MPNPVTTRCTVTGSPADVTRFRERMFVTNHDEQGNAYLRFDFEKIIPMPEVLRRTVNRSDGMLLAMLLIARGGGDDDLVNKKAVEKLCRRWGIPEGSVYEIADHLADRPEQEEAGLACLQAVLETGCVNWYVWSLRNWGTKWNAYSFEIYNEEPLEFVFYTAWSFPWPVFEALAQEFPGLQFKIFTADIGVAFAGSGCFNPRPGERPFLLASPHNEPEWSKLLEQDPEMKECWENWKRNYDRGVHHSSDGE